MREHRVVKQRVRLALVAGFAMTPAVAARPPAVDPAGPLSSIQTAIDLAQPGDFVLVQPGVYHERLVLRDRVSLVAQSPGAVTVDAEAEGPAVTAVGITSSTSINGFIFTHGSASAGGGLHGSAVDAQFLQCTFVDNSAAVVGGAYLRDGSRASFVGCTFSRNVASVGGGFYLDFAAIAISGSTVRNNHAQDGAALSANNAAEASVAYTCFYGNVATDGTVIACNLASPQFTNCTIASNTCGIGVIASGLGIADRAQHRLRQHGTGVRVRRLQLAMGGLQPLLGQRRRYDLQRRPGHEPVRRPALLQSSGVRLPAGRRFASGHGRLRGPRRRAGGLPCPGGRDRAP
jgi:hypothetical protein